MDYSFWGKPSALLLGHSRRSMQLGTEDLSIPNKELGLLVNSYLNEPFENQISPTPLTLSDNWNPGYLDCNFMRDLKLEIAEGHLGGSAG